MVERAVREVKDQVRVMCCTQSDKVGKVPSGNAAFDWMVIRMGNRGAHRSADRSRRHDELPSTARTGVEPSDCAVRRAGAREASACSETQGGLEPRWDLATYLGARWDTAEHFVSGADGFVYQARAVRRVPERQRWAAERVMNVTGVPEDRAREGGAGAPPVPAEAWRAVGEPEPDRRIVRGFHIKREDMVQHGYTRGCLRCDCYRTGRVTGVNHTHECRERFHKLVEEKGDGRVGRAHQRRGDLPDGPVAADVMEEEHGAHHGLPGPAGAPAIADAMEQELPDAASSEEVGTQPLENRPEEEEMIVDMVLRGASQELSPREVWRLCLIMGETANEAGKKVTELSSPPRANENINRMNNKKGIVAGTSFDVFVDKEIGEMWKF